METKKTWGVNLPEDVKNLAELYAVGSVSLSQLAEAVEEYSLSSQAQLMIAAMTYVEEYYIRYVEWQLKQK
jgi:hypothetical protein